MKRPRPPCNNNTHDDNTSFKSTKPFHYVARNYNPAHSFPRSLNDPSNLPHNLRQTSLWRISRKPRFVKGKLALDSSSSPCAQPASGLLKLRPPNFLPRKRAPSSLPACQLDEEDPIATPVFSTPRNVARRTSFFKPQNHPDTHRLPPHSSQEPSLNSAISSDHVAPDCKLITTQPNYVSSPTRQQNGLHTNLHERAHTFSGDHGPLVLFRAYASDSDESSSSCPPPQHKHQAASNQRTSTPSQSRLINSDLEENVSSHSLDKHCYPSTVPNRPASCSPAFPIGTQQRHCASVARTNRMPQTEPVCPVTPAPCIRRLTQSFVPTLIQTPHPEQMHAHRQELVCMPTGRCVQDEETSQASPSELHAVRTLQTPQLRMNSFRLPWDSPLGSNLANLNKYVEESLNRSKSTPENLHEQMVAEEKPITERWTLQPSPAGEAFFLQSAMDHAKDSVGADLNVSDAVEIGSKIDGDNAEWKNECSPDLTAVKKRENQGVGNQSSLPHGSVSKRASHSLKGQDEGHGSETADEFGCIGCKFGHYSCRKDRSVVASLEMEPVVIGTQSETIYPSPFFSARQLVDIKSAENEGGQLLAGSNSTGGKERGKSTTEQGEKGESGGEGQNSGSQAVSLNNRSGREECGDGVLAQGRAKLSSLKGGPLTTMQPEGVWAQRSFTQLVQTEPKKERNMERFEVNGNEEIPVKEMKVFQEVGVEAEFSRHELQEQERHGVVFGSDNTGNDQDAEHAADAWNDGARHERIKSGAVPFHMLDPSPVRSSRIGQENKQASCVFVPGTQEVDKADNEKEIDALCKACNMHNFRTPPQRVVAVRDASWLQKVLGQRGSASPEKQGAVSWKQSAEPPVGRAKKVFRRARSPARILRIATSELGGPSSDECRREGEDSVEECKQAGAEEVQDEERNVGGAEGITSMEEDEVCWDTGSLCIRLPHRHAGNVDDKGGKNGICLDQERKECTEKEEEDCITASPSQGEEEKAKSNRCMMRNEAEMGYHGMGVVCRPLLVRIAAGALRSPSTPASSDDEQIRVVQK